MKQYIFPVILFVILFISGCTQNKSDIADNTSIDPKIFQDIMTSSADAWNKGDLDGHLAIYDSSATFMASKGLIGIPSLKENFQKKYFNGSKPTQQLAFDEIVVKPLGPDFALITGKFTLSGGGQPKQSGRYSLVFKKTNAGWKVLHDHSS